MNSHFSKKIISIFIPMLCFTFVASAEGKKTITLALNWKAEPQFGGFYQTQLEKKIPLKILEGGSGTPTIQMLSFGKVDAAVVSAEEILISNAQNPQNPVVALFAVFQTNPQIWMTRQDRGFHSIADVLNHPGLVAAQSGLTYVQFLKKKYPHSKVQWVPYSGGIAGLINEKNYTQQGFLTSEPLLAEEKGIKVSTFLIADEGFNPYTTVLAVRKSDLKSKRQEILKWVEAIRKGWEDYLKNPLPANQLMGQINTSMDAKTFQKSSELQKKLIEAKSLGSMTEKRWDSLIQTLVRLKILAHPLKAQDQFINLK